VQIHQNTKTREAARNPRRSAENLHFSCSQDDSIKSTRKESHSFRASAKQFLPDASSRINDLRGQKSSTNTQCIGKKSEEEKEP
jgi:hypothetical protein